MYLYLAFLTELILIKFWKKKQHINALFLIILAPYRSRVFRQSDS